MLSIKEESKFKIRGRISKGLNEGRNFIQIPWVRRQFINKLGIDPYPGTLNLEILDGRDLENYRILKSTEAIEIIPEDPSFCKARCHPVLINKILKGAIVIPLVEGYPENKMEIIAQENLKERFHLKDGDFLEIEVLQVSLSQ